MSFWRRCSRSRFSGLPSCRRSGISKSASGRRIATTRRARDAGSEACCFGGTMANDGRPKEHDEEREFLAGLKARTGRDLAEWMAAIAAQGFGDKNEIIDWLRTQGLPFARASWLERIHRNGGKPIYAGGA